ncbi:hypothetical protein CEXT_682201 [Caerostris extrusa]|uniref:Uncharacterized protein n=1 Tax=Caerostris extrusa TaxID=172846 RepID=A0AAV4PD30_CAEEX|nr:hypothetical protein CEXT_682201 [Caerostris extrusa]
MLETVITPSPKAHVTDDRCRESNPNPARQKPRLSRRAQVQARNILIKNCQCKDLARQTFTSEVFPLDLRRPTGDSFCTVTQFVVIIVALNSKAKERRHHKHSVLRFLMLANQMPRDLIPIPPYRHKKCETRDFSLPWQWGKQQMSSLHCNPWKRKVVLLQRKSAAAGMNLRCSHRREQQKAFTSGDFYHS